VPHPQLLRDIRPLTEFRAHSAAFIDHVQTATEPIILTQHGRACAVLLGVNAYAKLLDDIELLRDVRTAEDQVARESGSPHEQVVTRIRAALGR
jgi:antitoxin YefM